MPEDCNWWQPNGCEWTIGYLWRWTTWITQLDIFVLALMLAYVLVVVIRGSYGYHVARRESRVFVRDASQALRRGAFEEVIAVATRTNRSHVATMLAAGLAAFGSARSQCTLAEAIESADRTFRHSQKKLTAEFNRGLGTLKSIASTSPLLGLAGTCLGIMSAFRGVGMERHAVLVMWVTGAGAALLTTASGLLVAVPAVWSYNYLRVRIDRVESEMSNAALEAITHLNAHPQWFRERKHFIPDSEAVISEDAGARSWDVRHQGERVGRHRLPLKKRISELPAFALIAAPGLTLAIAGFMTFSSFYTPVGMIVRLLRHSELVTENSLSIESIVVGLQIGNDGQTALYVNSKKTQWEKLARAVSEELELRPKRTVYVLSGRNVSWADVAKVIDLLQKIPSDVVLLTIAPNIDSSHLRRRVRR
jgi:biopolymer transport protein TolQ